MSRYLITNSKYEAKPTVQMPAVIVDALSIEMFNGRA